MSTAGTWDGLALAISHDRVVLGPEGARLFVRLLDRYAQVERMPLSPAAGQVRRTCHQVAFPACAGHEDIDDPADDASLAQWITTKQLADGLGVTQRHASRLASAGEFGPVRRLRGRLMVREDEVAAYAAAKGERHE